MATAEPSRAPGPPATPASLQRLDQVLADDALLDVIGTASLSDAEPHHDQATGEDGRGDLLLADTLLEWRRYLES